MVAVHVHELRNESAEEDQHLRVRQQHQETLQEEPAARRRRRLVDIDALDRRPDQLDAEPDQIGGAGKAHPVEPVAHGRHQRSQADRDDADDNGEAYLCAGDIGQRRARAVAQAVGDDEGDDRTRQQRQRNAGGDEGEIGLHGHHGEDSLGAVWGINAWHSLSVQRRRHPRHHLRRLQEREDRALHHACFPKPLRRRNEEIATA